MSLSGLLDSVPRDILVMYGIKEWHTNWFLSCPRVSLLKEYPWGNYPDSCEYSDIPKLYHRWGLRIFVRIIMVSASGKFITSNIAINRRCIFQPGVAMKSFSVKKKRCHLLIHTLGSHPPKQQQCEWFCLVVIQGFKTCVTSGPVVQLHVVHVGLFEWLAINKGIL